MKDFLKLNMVALATGALLLTGCDLSGLSKVEDDFQLKIGLEPINATVFAEIIDASSLAPVPNAQITFSGDQAGSLIDAYSDPISGVNATSGFASFGIKNEVVPSGASPVSFVATVEAPGYRTERIRVRLEEASGGSFAVRLVPNDVTRPIAGTTAGQQTQPVPADANGTLTQPMQFETSTGETMLIIPQGATLKTAGGQAVTGNVTASVRVFTGGEGLLAAPRAITQEDDVLRQVIAIQEVSLKDASGQEVAVTYPAATGSKLTASSEGAVLGKRVASSAVEHLKSYSFVDALRGFIGRNVEVFEGTLMVKGRLEGVSDEYIDVHTGCEVKQVHVSAVAFVRVLGTGSAPTCDTPPASTVCDLTDASLKVMNPNSSAVSYDVRLEAEGVNQQKTGFTLAANQEVTLTLAAIAGVEQAQLTAAGAEGKITLTATTGSQSSKVELSAAQCPTGVTTLTLPEVSGLQEHTIEARMSCSNNRRFDPQFTQDSFDGLLVAYQKLDNGRPSGSTTRVQGFEKSVSPGAISVTGTLLLEPNATYRFNGVFGSRSGSHEVQTSQTSVLVAFDGEDYGWTCTN